MTGPSDSSVPLPCPFCGSNNAAPYSVKSNHSVLCVACGGEGPEQESDDEAIAAWNRRAALPVAALSDADRELMEQAMEALTDVTEVVELGDPRWGDHRCFKAAEAAIAALRTRLLRHSEGKE